MRRVLLAIMLLGLLAAGGWYYLKHRDAPTIDFVPNEVGMLVLLHPSEVMKSRIWADVVAARGQDEGIRRLSERCHVDVSTAIEELVIFVPTLDAAPRGSDVTVIARGSANGDKVLSCIQSAVAADGGHTQQLDIDGYPGLASQGDSRIVVARGAIIFGSERNVRRVLAVLRGEAPNARGTRVQPLLESNADLALFGTMPRAWSDQFALAGSLIGGIPEALGHLSTVEGTINVDDKLHLDLRAELRGLASASAAVATLQGRFGQIGLELDATPGAGSADDGTSTLTVRANLSPEQIQSLIPMLAR